MKDYSGMAFGRLIVVGFSHRKKSRYFWECKCSCGNITVKDISLLVSGNTRSCGCLAYENRLKNISPHKTHGLEYKDGKETKLYRAWCSMKTRCYMPIAKYKYWNGKGVEVCAEWKNDYLCFHNWAIKNGHKNGLSLDRINNNKGYSPDNCQWITKSQNTIKAHLGKGGWKRDKNRKKIFSLHDNASK